MLGQVCSARAAAIDAVSKEVDLEHFPHFCPYFSTFHTLLPQLTDSDFVFSSHRELAISPRQTGAELSGLVFSRQRQMVFFEKEKK